MLITEREHLSEQLRELADRYDRHRTALIPMLQFVQRKQGYVNSYTMQVIADLLGIHPVEVHSVVSFYSFLSDKPTGKFVIRLCRTISCDLAGKDAIARQLQTELGIGFGQTTEDRMFTLEWANCIGMCDRGPALLVNDRVYTQVTPEKVHEIIAECRNLFGPHALEREEDHLV